MATTTTTTPTAQSQSRMQRLSGWSQRHHWLALMLWVLVLVGITVGSQVVGSDYHDDHALPGTESQELSDTMDEHAPERSGDMVQIVLHDEGGLSDPSTRQRVDGMLDDVTALPHVADVASPYQSQEAVSDDGTIAYASVTLDGSSTDVPTEAVRDIVDTAHAAEGDGLQVELGGDAVRGAEEAEGVPAEAAGILAALVILVFMFGSFLAATLPVITAIFAVGSTLGVIVLMSNLATIASYTPPLMMLVGLGVGIDYALLIFARYRSELRRGADRQEAARIALDTAGRLVIFAGGTVVIALLGLFALGLGSLQGVALAVALTVLVTMVASLTLLPSLLTVFGRRVERRIVRHHEKMARTGRVPGRQWRRLADGLARRPWPPLTVAVVLLAALSVPALGMRLGFADAGTDPESTTSRQAYDLLAEGFGPGINGPLVVVADGIGESAGAELHQALLDTRGIASATPPQFLPDADIGISIVFPDSGPAAEATSELVDRLRADRLPELAGQTGGTYLVGGSTAAADDFASAVRDRLPMFLAVVVGLSALLLMSVFRSVLIPLKAAVLNLLSVGAALGVITLVFGEGMFGVQGGVIEAFVPVMIFAIVFGLSMDYEVFLVSRMHEEWRRTGDAARAIREGLARTGGVVLAAAAIMVVVFGAFMLSPDRMLQQFGLGLAVAVFLDAVVVRCLIVPAVMRLFGTRAWWLPRWLDRMVPTVPLERTETVSPARFSPEAGSATAAGRGVTRA